MSDLDKVLALSATVACTVGLEPLMFPTGLTDDMVTPLAPPRLALVLAPDLVLGLDLPEVLCLLGLPTCTPFFSARSRCFRWSLLRPEPSHIQETRPTLAQPYDIALRSSLGGPGDLMAHRATEDWRISPVSEGSFAESGAASPRVTSNAAPCPLLQGVLTLRAWDLDHVRTTNP